MTHRSEHGTAAPTRAVSWEERLDEFVCLRCGNCCKGEGAVALNREDIRRIAAHLEMTQVDFLREHTHRVDNRTALADQRGPERWCVFFDGRGCRIDTVKPKQCSDFPTRWRNPDSAEFCEGLQALT